MYYIYQIKSTALQKKKTNTQIINVLHNKFLMQNIYVLENAKQKLQNVPFPDLYI